MNDHATDHAADHATDDAPDRIPDRIPDRTPDRTPDRVTDDRDRPRLDDPLAANPGPRKESAALLLMDIRDVLKSEIGMHEPFAELVSEALCRGLRSRWGGRKIYVPVEDLAERTARIKAAWRGNNAAEIMVRFGVSRSTLYRVLNDR